MAYGRIEDDLGEGERDFSSSKDQSQFQDYADSSSRRKFTDPEQAYYHPGPQKGQDYQDYLNEQKSIQDELAKAENANANGPNSSSSTDNSSDPNEFRDQILNRENTQTDSASNFNYTNTGNKSKNKKPSSFFARHKKGVIGWAVGGGLAVGVFVMGTVLSGPLQFLHIAALLQDTVEFVNNIPINVRTLKNVSRIANNTADAISGAVRNSKIGTTVKNIATSISSTKVTNLARNGVSLADDATELIIDASKKANFSSILRRFGNAVSDLPDGSVKVAVDQINSSWGRLGLFFEANKTGKFGGDIAAWLTARSQTIKAGGRGSAFTPIKHFKLFMDDVKNDVKEKTIRAILKKVSEIAAVKQLRKVGVKAKSAIKNAINSIMSTKVMRTITQTIPDFFRKGKNALDNLDKAGKPLGKGQTNIGVIGVAVDILDMLCTLEALDNEAGERQMFGIIQEAMLESQNMKSTASAVQSGFKDGDTILDVASDEECENDANADECVILSPMEQLGVMTKQKLYNDEIGLSEEYINETVSENEEGDWGGEASKNETVTATDKILTSSAWDSAILKSLLNESYDELDVNETVPAEILTVSTDGFKNLTDRLGVIGSAVAFVSNGLSSIPGASAVCNVVNNIFVNILLSIGAYIGDIALAGAGIVFTAGIGTGALTAISISVSLGFAAATMALTNIINGDGLVIDETTPPSHYGSIHAAGSFYGSIIASVGSGGRELDDGEVAELWDMQRRYLAEQWADKPLWAKLFDPTDYRSTISVIARAANFDISSQDWKTQVGNVVRFFGSLPKLFGMAINNIGGVAYADSSKPFGGWDFGLPIYSYSVNEIDKLTSSGHDEPGNTDKVEAYLRSDINGDGEINDDDKDEFNRRIKYCFGVEMTDYDTMELKQILNYDGSNWNFIDKGKKATGKASYSYDCDNKNDDWFSIRLYIMDYFSLSGVDCYSGDEVDSDSCEAAGYGDGH